jgi:HEAT repeat protein
VRILALLLALLAAGCANLLAGEFGEAMDDTAEFFGADLPIRDAKRLRDLHAEKGFAHVPDEPATWVLCAGRIAVLEESHYEDWREVGAALAVLTRVLGDDDAVHHRILAAGAVGRLGGWCAGVEEPPDGPVPDVAAAAAAVRRLADLRQGEPTEEAAAERVAILRLLGDFRVPLPTAPGASRLAPEIRSLREVLTVAFLEGRGGDEAGDAAAERALANLGARIARLALADALLHDEDRRVRAAAAEALAAAGGPALLPFLGSAAAREREAAVRRPVVAAAAAAPAGDAEGFRILLKALEDDDRSLRILAREALKARAGADLGPAAPPWAAWWAGRDGGP